MTFHSIVQNSHKLIKNTKRQLWGKAFFSRIGKRRLLLYPPVTSVARCCILNAKPVLSNRLTKGQPQPCMGTLAGLVKAMHCITLCHVHIGKIVTADTEEISQAKLSFLGAWCSAVFQLKIRIWDPEHFVEAQFFQPLWLHCSELYNLQDCTQAAWLSQASRLALTH